MAENMDVIATGSIEGSSRTPASTTKDQSKGQTVQVSVPLVPTVSTVSVNHNEKPDKFTGVNFKTWQQKMLFYLKTLNLARFLKEDPPFIGEDEIDVQTQQAIDACKHAEFLCRNYLLNGLSDTLYGVYNVKKTAKELWNSLDHKYKAEDAGAKKFLVGQFLNFKMVDSKNVISHVQELQLIIHGIHAEGMVLSESFQVAAIIEKLPPAWKDFKNYLKHKQKEMSVEELILRLRVEEDNQGNEKRTLNPNAAKANLMEHDRGSKGKNPKHKKGPKLGPKGGIAKKPKFQGKCFNCGKMGHKSSECKLRKKKGNETYMVDAISQEVVELDLCAVVSEVNLVDANPKEW
ncbi:uncharacterized protein LOC133778550 [Humulus lupulus]|uniref:uncharacterized protein LOC133778550 n=1 Tax=Humulus lupulus TaxID=3486 RepID=UPI002B40A26E|nr:uncharacterized protein LOC133778550 [Humulus lupulus]